VRAPAPFSALHARLLRRRIDAIEPVLRLELAGVAALLGAFLWLQVRPLFEDAAFRWGPWGAAIALEGAGILLCALAARLVAARHARRLAAPEGPAWGALPIEPRALAAHLAWESKFQALWVAVPLAALVASTAGLVPVWALVLLAMALAGFLWMAAEVGVALGRAGVRRAAPVAAGRANATAAPRAWRAVPAWRAVVAKDARTAFRSATLRPNALFAAAFAALSFAGWLLPTAGPPGAPASAFDLRNLATFFVTLAAAGVFAEWLVLLTGSDPFATLRALPVGVRTMWTARFAWALAFTAVLLVGHALLSHGLTSGARALFLAWVAAATLGIAVLGIQFGLSLWPHAAAARQLLGLTFLVMGVASIAFFLSGWLVLVVALAWTALRLPRWARASEAA
jgi:hypothetical protein